MSERPQRLRLVEALLFASAEPLDEAALTRHLDEGSDVRELLAELAESYAGRGVNLVRLAGGWAFRTAPDLAARLRIERRVTRKLSRAAVETLAVIAYHQPVTRAEIEEIRGVALGKGTPRRPRPPAPLGDDLGLPRAFWLGHPCRAARRRRAAHRRPPRSRLSGVAGGGAMR
jgi:Segregation and condensation complex subunit ScpB